MMDFLARVKLLCSKLEIRGYSGKILKGLFLRFSSRYPVCIRYGVTNGESLRLMTKNYNATKSCCVYDYKSVEEIVILCKIILDDCYSQEKCQIYSSLEPMYCVFRENIF